MRRGRRYEGGRSADSMLSPAGIWKPSGGKLHINDGSVYQLVTEPQRPPGPTGGAGLTGRHIELTEAGYGL
jgi:hypothetical protein